MNKKLIRIFLFKSPYVLHINIPYKGIIKHKYNKYSVLEFRIELNL